MNKRKVIIISMTLGTAIILLAAFTVFIWAVFLNRSDHQFIRALASKLPIPAARLGSRWIPYRDFLRNRDTLRTFLGSKAAQGEKFPKTVDAGLEKNILEKLVVQEALYELAEQKGISVTEAELRQSFSKFLSVSSSTQQDVGLYLLENYGWDEEDFRQEVIRPAILEERLGEQLSREQNGDASALARHIENRVKSRDVVRYLRF